MSSDSAELRSSTFQRAVPRPHQGEAVSNSVSELNIAARARVVMACGTGKSLVALWGAEKMAVNTVIVFVPSLGLIKQLLGEWLRTTTWGKFTVLTVCSDKSVVRDLDEIVMSQEEFGYPVTTFPEKVREFFSTKIDGVKLVFSTYQSAAVVGAGMGPEDEFDLGIFDEAHKTAGYDGKQNSFALSDENLRIRKRLFLTATPRHCRLPGSDKSLNGRRIYSMDNEAVYGRLAYHLSFREAVRRNLIVPYKIVVSVITSDDLAREHLAGTIEVGKEKVSRMQIANQLALKAAIEKYNVRRVFTFHQRVIDAVNFTASKASGIGRQLPSFFTSHITGAMSAAKREDVIQKFSEAERGILSNARCLTEGVDVPAVDMVAFMSPKKSRVDIVQAAGRAMRKSPGKEQGYVFLPIFVELGKSESIDDAISKSVYDEAWAVMKALAENDDEFGHTIRIAAQNFGECGAQSETFDEYIDIVGPAIHLDQLRRGISACLVDEIGDTWDVRFGELIAFKKENGHCNVTRAHPNKCLRNWVATQRLVFSTGRLSAERREKLDEIGFVWAALDSKWDHGLRALIKFKATHGHCRVAQAEKSNAELGRWVSAQRTASSRGYLSAERKAKLDEIGFVWAALDSKWDHGLRALIKFKATHGHCRVPHIYADDINLGSWVGTQRNAFLNGRLNAQRRQTLDEIGFVWGTINSKWDHKLDALIKFKARYGHCNVSKSDKSHAKLGQWVSTQRKAFSKGLLSAERRAKLDEIGFVWAEKELKWDHWLDVLIKFKARHGHCNVSAADKSHAELGQWVGTQRKAFSRGRLSAERRAKLDDIGFVWAAHDSKWGHWLDVLIKFKARHGHCNVSAADKSHANLVSWIRHQRSYYKNGSLSTERIHKLKEIGFSWNPVSERDEMRLVELEAFKDAFGHCNIPKDNLNFRELYCWLETCRGKRRFSKISTELRTRLDKLGAICFNSRDAAWESMFAQLRQFKAENGHCIIPPSRNSNLRHWLNYQRCKKRRNALNADKINRLTGIGVEWDLSRGPRSGARYLKQKAAA